MNAGELCMLNVNELLEVAISETEKLNQGEIFLVCDLC